jgi:hypothetical protein
MLRTYIKERNYTTSGLFGNIISMDGEQDFLVLDPSAVP